MVDEDTRKRILEAAGPRFAEQGFEATTIREICREAGVNLAAVNYHFGDKERLCIESIKHAHEFRIEQVPMPKWSPATPAQVRLRDFVRTLLTRLLGVQNLPWQEVLMLREMYQPSGACRELVEDVIRPHFELLLGIIDELVAADTPDYQRHQLAFSVVGQCLFYKFNQRVVEMLIPEAELKRHYTPAELTEHILAFTMSGLSELTVDRAAVAAAETSENE